MVVFGGLELVAAGYLIHKHNQNKRERALIREEAAALEEQQYPLQDEPPYTRPHRHSHSHGREETKEERKERHRRRRSRERRERERWEYENSARPGRDHSAPPKMQVSKQQRPAAFPGHPQAQTQTPQPGGIVTGWPGHWQQTQTPATPPPPHAQPPPPPPAMNPNGYPQDVKYGFVPEIPHDQYPPYPPPPFSPGPGPSSGDGRGRASTLDVNDGRRGRPKTRRSVSPRLGTYDEYSRSPSPHVRFSNEDVVLGEGRGGGRRSPPPRYGA